MATTEGPIHLCYDRTLPLALTEEAKRIAVQENPANEVDPNLDVNDPNLPPAERIALIAQKRRRPGKLLKIRFLDGSLMRYAFPASLTRNSVGTTSNTKLSQLHIDFIKLAYPRRSAPGSAPTAQLERPAPSRELIGSRPNPEPDDAGTREARGAGSTFRALLIGIDFYSRNRLPNDATYVSLHGCVRDVERIEEMLRARITTPLEITKLLARNVGGDEPGGPRSDWPTYDNMKAALDGLLARTQPGDQVYIHYSGHGGRVLTKFTDLKPGGYDETLVPTDIGKDSTRYLHDLEIAHYLDALTTKNKAIVTVVLDSCHSGDATRGVDIAPRCATGAREGVDPTLDTTERPTDGVAPDDELRAAWKRLEATASEQRGAVATTWLPEARDYVLLAACRDIESALEASIECGRSENDQQGGVLTTALLQALRGLGIDQTWKVVYERVLACVHSKFPSQTPQLLGQRERQVLGVELRPVVNTVRVSNIDVPKRRVKLSAGRTTGTEKGATFGIYRAGTVDFTQLGKRVGAATVEEVKGVESWASLEEGAEIKDVELGAPARLEDLGSIQLRRAVNLFRRDDLPPEIDQDQALRAVGDAITTRGRGFLELVTHGTPHYQVALNKDRHYEIWEPSGKPFPNVGTVAIDALDAAEVVVDRLLHLLRYQTVNEVADPFSGLKDAIHIELRSPPPGWSEGKPFQGGTVIEPHGDAYAMKPDSYVFVHVTNDGDRPVNIATLDLGDNYGIQALDPPPFEGGLTPARSYSTVDARKDHWFAVQVYLPPGRDSVRDVIKVFASVGDTDFWWLLQTPIDKPVTRSPATRGDAARDALFRLRQALDADENTMRAGRPVSKPGEDWTVRQICIDTIKMDIE